MLGFRTVRRGNINAVHDLFVIGVCSAVVLLNGAFLTHLEKNIQSFLTIILPGVMLCAWYLMTTKVVKEVKH